MKNCNYGKCTVYKNTNLVYSNGAVDWGGTREGALITIGEYKCTFTILKVENRLIHCAAAVGDSTNKLLIKGRIPALFAGDMLTVFYEKYTLGGLLKIVESGTDYQVGDVITVIGGTVAGEKTKFKVTEITDKGGIKGVALLENGAYLRPPASKSYLISDSGNQTALFDMEFTAIPVRESVDASIEHINYNPTTNTTMILLNNQLPGGVSAVFINVTKSVATLKETFPFADAVGVNYTIYQNVTPHLGLILGNDPVLNHNLTRIDSAYAQLQAALTK